MKTTQWSHKDDSIGSHPKQLATHATTERHFNKIKPPSERKKQDNQPVLKDQQTLPCISLHLYFGPSSSLLPDDTGSTFSDNSGGRRWQEVVMVLSRQSGGYCKPTKWTGSTVLSRLWK